MKILFNQTLMTIHNKPFEGMTNEKGEKENLDLKKVCVEALLSVDPDNRSEDGAQKFKNWELAKKINVDSEVELTAEEISLIKAKVGKFYAPAIVGPAFSLLENK